MRMNFLSQWKSDRGITARDMPNQDLAPPPDLILTLADDAATARLGTAFGAVLRAGDAVLLTGGLGAGKTALARAAILARLGATGRVDEVPSPTFTLVQTYEADIPVWHADLYRLSGEDEVYELGLDEAFEKAAVFVEWPDRLGGAAPARWLAIHLDFDARGEGRIAAVRQQGGSWSAALKAMEHAV